MSRKKAEFRWERCDRPDATIADGDRPDLDPEGTGRPASGEHRAQMQDLKDLANRLARLPHRQRRTLPLGEETLDQLDRLEAAHGRVDRPRVLLRARLLLGREDLTRLDAALAGDTDAAEWERELVRWQERIIAGDDLDIQAFMVVFPQADRQAIRTIAREARGEGQAIGAHIRLLRLLRGIVAARVGETLADGG